MRILVTGGAGYVGSFASRELVRCGHEVAILDDLRQGHRAAVPGVPVVEGDVADRALVARLLESRHIELVMHFAAATNVGESVADPAYHYRNNASAGLVLLETMRASGVERLVFSSSAATYGVPATTPIPEDAPLAPVSPYGRSKLAVEWMIRDFARAHGLRFAVLRYFNAAGASADGAHGEDHRPETHLIPRILTAALGRSAGLELYGDDFDTPDGTCVRDYVHVEDLARAHVLAVQALGDPGAGLILNVGTGVGRSVREVVAAAERVTGRRVPHRVGPRRPGDPPRLVARADRVREQLGWQPERSKLEDILATALAWHRDRPEGYA